jgi:response regulator of citrate/malate metabolism
MAQLVKKKMTKSYFRLDLDKFEYEVLVDMLNYIDADKRRCSYEKENNSDAMNELYEKVRCIKEIEKGKKSFATDKAHQVKRDISLKKVNEAIKELELLKRTVTAYSVARYAGISFVTAQKYLKLFEQEQEQEQVEILE